MVQCTIEYFVSLIVADAFLAKPLTHIGISDSLVGIISSFISLAFLFQLMSICFVKIMKNTKHTVISFDTVSRIFFMGIYFVPFIPVNQGLRTIIVIVMLLMLNIFNFITLILISCDKTDDIPKEDKTSYATGINLALVIIAVGFAINIFATPSTWWLIVVFTILSTMSVAGLNYNMYNICYSYVESDYIVQAMAIKNSIVGLCGFGMSLVSSRVLSAIQANGNRIFGITMYGQQFLSAISFVIIAISAVFCYKVVRKQKVIKQ